MILFGGGATLCFLPEDTCRPNSSNFKFCGATGLEQNLKKSEKSEKVKERFHSDIEACTVGTIRSEAASRVVI